MVHYTNALQWGSRAMRRLVVLLLGMLLLLSACNAGGNQGSAGDAGNTAGGQPDSASTSDAGNTMSETDSASVDDAELSGPVTISFGLLEFQRQTYSPIIEAFNAENPSIRVEIVSLDDIFGIGGNHGPDIATLMSKVVRAADTAAPFIPPRPEDIEYGYVQDLKPLMEADPLFDRDDFYPGAFTTIGDEGGVYQLPHTLPVPVLMYNKELWAASGLPEPDPNWTWNDLISAAEQIAQKRGDTIESYGLMADGSGTTPIMFELQNAGIDIYGTPIEEIQFDAPAFAAALERVQNLADSGAIYVTPSESGVARFVSGDTSELIQSGQVGIWRPSMFSMGADAEEPAFEVGTLPMPTVHGEIPSLLTGTPSGYVMSGGTEHPQEAWRWLAFLSRQDVQPNTVGLGRNTLITQIPARKSLAEESGYWSELDEETAEVIRQLLERETPSLPVGLSNDINIVFELLNKALGVVVNGNQEVPQALQEAQSDLAERVAERQLTPEPTADTAPVVVATLESEERPSGGTEVSFATMWVGADNIRTLAKEFNKQNSDVFVSVNNIEIAQGDMPEFAEIAAANDCFMWLGEPSQSELTATLDLQPLLDADANFPLDDYPDVFFEPYRQGSGLYGLPYAASLMMLNYNQTAFDTAGLAYPSATWTLDDMLNTAQQINSGEGQDRVYGFVSMSTSQDVFFFLNRFGAHYTRGDGDTIRPNYTDPQVIEALQFYITLLREYSPHTELMGYKPNSWDSEPFQLANEGRVGMWMSLNMFPGQDESRDFTLAVAPPPIANSTVTLNDFNVRGFHISADTEYAQGCWQWITFLSNDASYLMQAFPARMSLLESEAFTSNARPGATEVYQAYQDALANTTDIAQQPDRSNMDYYWLFQAVDRALQGENLEQELANAQDMTEQYIVCVQTGQPKHVCAKDVDPSYQGFATAESDE